MVSHTVTSYNSLILVRCELAKIRMTLLSEGYDPFMFWCYRSCSTG